MNTRRKFIWTTGAVIGTSMLGGSTLVAKHISSAVAERDVAGIISRYGSNMQETRDENRAVEYRVKVSDIRHFEKVFTSQHKLPFDRIHVVNGNTLKFTHGGIDFTLVNII